MSWFANFCRHTSCDVPFVNVHELAGDAMDARAWRWGCLRLKCVESHPKRWIDNLCTTFGPAERRRLGCSTRIRLRTLRSMNVRNAIEKLRNTAEGRSLSVFVVTILLLGACVQIGDSQESPKKDESSASMWYGSGIDSKWSNRLSSGAGKPHAPSSATSEDSNGIVLDQTTNLMWQRVIDTKTSWATAKTYCETLTLGNFSDWRLPSPKELASMADFSQTHSSIDIDEIPSNHPGETNSFWTSSLVANASSAAWTVDVKSGSLTRKNHFREVNWVRCVRQTIPS